MLVTGAGGSIGSEIARQVARFKPGPAAAPRPRREPAARDRQRRPRRRRGRARRHPRPPATARDLRALPARTSCSTRPRTSTSRSSSGTRSRPRTRTCSARGGSRGSRPSSAAVASCTSPPTRPPNPCSVMGATKRAAELVVFQVGSEHNLPYAAVRFGNVLGSRGSVVPTFLRQILEGGPVTVTDPEMTRYFMTIPEAVSLVLQAGAMADEGKVFLLDMGKPVSIIDLARQMIRLVGAAARTKTSQIEITGAPSRRAPARAAARRRRDRRADAPPVDLGRAAELDARPRDAVLLLGAAREQVRARRRPSPRSRRCSRSCCGAAASRASCNSRRASADDPLAAPDAAVVEPAPLEPRRRAPPTRRAPAACRGPHRQAPGAARRDRRPSRPPSPSPGRPGRRSNGSGGASSRPTTAACSRTARSSPSSRTASPSGSASPTSSRSARAPPA